MPIPKNDSRHTLRLPRDLEREIIRWCGQQAAESGNRYTLAGFLRQAAREKLERGKEASC